VGAPGTKKLRRVPVCGVGAAGAVSAMAPPPAAAAAPAVAAAKSVVACAGGGTPWGSCRTGVDRRLLLL
jgi:hypothetical protein